MNTWASCETIEGPIVDGEKITAKFYDKRHPVDVEICNGIDDGVFMSLTLPEVEEVAKFFAGLATRLGGQS